MTPSIQVTSLSAFRNEDFDVLIDEDISELDLTRTRVHEIQHQVSEELTIASRGQRLTWIGGLFLFDEVSRMPSSVLFPESGVDYRFDPRVDADATAIFGQASVGLTSRMTVTAGLRYTHERKTMANSGGLYTLDVPATLLPGSSFAFTDAISHDAWTPKVRSGHARPRKRAGVRAPRRVGSKAVGSAPRQPRPGSDSRRSSPGAMRAGSRQMSEAAEPG